MGLLLGSHALRGCRAGDKCAEHGKSRENAHELQDLTSWGHSSSWFELTFPRSLPERAPQKRALSRLCDLLRGPGGAASTIGLIFLIPSDERAEIAPLAACEGRKSALSRA